MASLRGFPGCCKASIAYNLFAVEDSMKKIKATSVTKTAPDNFVPKDFHEPVADQYSPGYSRVWFAIGKPGDTVKLKKAGWGPIARVPSHVDWEPPYSQDNGTWKGTMSNIMWMYPAPPENEQIDI